MLIVSHYSDELFDEEELALGIDMDGPPSFKFRGGQPWPVAHEEQQPYDPVRGSLAGYNQTPAARNQDARQSYQDCI